MAQREMTLSGLKGIMNNRVMVPTTAIGKRVKLLVQGDGTEVDVFDKEGNPVDSITEPGQQLRKRIYNTRANSQLAMSNARNKEYLMNAIKCDKTGGTVKGIIGNEPKASEHTCAEYCNAYLNSVQIGFALLLPSTAAERITSGVEIAATIVKIETDNGSLLTIDPSTISVQAPETLSKTSFSLDDFEDDDETDTKPTGKSTVKDAVNNDADEDEEDDFEEPAPKVKGKAKPAAASKRR